MGKKKRLNRLISRWIKSDLPEEDGSPTVLLLGVTRIPSSPPAHPRRPQSLAFAPPANPAPRRHHYPLWVNDHPPPQAVRPARPVSVVHPYTFTQPADDDAAPSAELTKLECGTPLPNGGGGGGCGDGNDGTPTNPPQSVGDADSPPLDSSSSAPAGHSNHSSSAASCSVDAANMERSVDSIGACSLDVDASAELQSDWCENPSVDTLRSASINSLTPQQDEQQRQHRLPSYLSLACTVNGYSQSTNYDPVRLAKSRDSSPHRPLIDADALTYAIHNNLLSPPNVVPLPLPLTDRFRHQHNNTLPSPATSRESLCSKMTERARTITHHHEEFYSKKQMFISSETTTRKYNYISEAVGIDRVDTCLDKSTFHGHHQIVHQVHETKTSLKEMMNGINGHANGHMNGGGTEPKSFIQQRVERLYGPGALAQGFFVMKRQKSRNSESDAHTQTRDTLNVSADNDKHSKSMSDKLLLDADYDSDASMKQSASSPSLPVLRHLTPEFRAQLPTFSPRRGADTLLQKSTTLPQLKVEMHNDDVLTITQNGTPLLQQQPPVDRSGGVSKLEKHLEQQQHLHENNNCLNGIATKIVEPVDAHVDHDDCSEVKDGHYFLRILENETIRLLELADKAEEELEAGEAKLSENAKGFLRSASGKARLLVSQKMQQFRGLCTNNLNQAEGEAYPTTNQDLQGFWDMVMLQVDQIDSLFKELDVMRANGWQEVVKPVDTVDKGKTVRAKVPSQGSRPRTNNAGVEEARAKREAQRRQIIEQRRKAMREAKSKSAASESIEIFVPESS